MYANLTVTTSRGKELAAWRVEFDPKAGVTTVHLDKNDGGGNYAEEGGILKLRGKVTVSADF